MAENYSDSLDLLQVLARLLGSSHLYPDILEKALTLVAEYLGLARIAISMLDPCDGKIRITAAYGLAPDQIRRAEYLPGEGITGSVISKGKPIYVDDIAREPLFLNRTRARNPRHDHTPFLCVPIIYNGDVIGSLWLDHNPASSHDPDACLRLMIIIAALLAPYAYLGGVKNPRIFKPNRKFGRFIGNSPKMQQVYAQIMQVAPSRLSVFLDGESGTGKELAAQAIHESSHCSSGPFISVNCAAIPESLIESELFGHEKGAFTGASQTRKGKFELADQGTLFLDEIGEMSLPAQARLLRVLQEHTFERVGGSRTLHVDVRIITATNRNLAKMVEEGTFRQDLFYRLNVFPIHMPPLRERREDIPLLVCHFLNISTDLSRRPQPEVSNGAMHLLQTYSWPGNVRELQNVMERAILLMDKGNTILQEHLPASLTNIGQPAGTAIEKPHGNLTEKLAEYEKKALIYALTQTHGHIGKAARNLGLTERKFSLRLTRYGLNYMDYRK